MIFAKELGMHLFAAQMEINVLRLKYFAFMLSVLSPMKAISDDRKQGQRADPAGAGMGTGRCNFKIRNNGIHGLRLRATCHKLSSHDTSNHPKHFKDLLHLNDDQTPKNDEIHFNKNQQAARVPNP